MHVENWKKHSKELAVVPSHSSNGTNQYLTTGVKDDSVDGGHTGVKDDSGHTDMESPPNSVVSSCMKEGN